MRLPPCRNRARAVDGAALAMALLAGACGQLPVNGGIACTAQFVYGISATVADATTGADITSGSYMVAREGSYVDSVSAMGNFLSAAGERAGTYSVTIGRPGYSSFTQTNVVVNRDECHVIPVRLAARLLRNP